MKFTTDKKKIILSIIFLLTSLLFLSFGFKFYKVDGQVKSLYFILSILLSFIISLVIATKVTFKSKKLNKIYLISTSILLVLGSYLSLELLNRQSLMHFSIIRTILNLGLIIVSTIIAFIYSNNTKKSLLIGTIFPYLLGIINYISVLQDNTPFILFRTFSIMPTGGIVNAIISYQLVLATFTTLLIVLLIRNINYEIKPIDLSKITKIIDFKPTKKSIIIGVLLLVLGMGYLAIDTNSFIGDKADNLGVFFSLYYFIAIVLVLIISTITIFKVKPKGKLLKFYPVIMTIVGIVLSFVILELFNENSLGAIISIEWKRLLLNFLIITALYAFIYALTNRLKITMIINSIIFYVLGLIQYTVVCFRGTPFTPIDILSAKTGLAVAGGYEFSVNMYLIIGTLLFILLIILITKIKTKPHKSIRNKIIRILLLIYVIVLAIFISTTDVKTTFELRNDLWSQTDEYKENGFISSFTKRITDLIPKEPSGYSKEKITKTLETIKKDNKKEEENKDTPNVIVIMNEAFSDLAVNGDFETTEDYMPYYRSLKENTIKGNAYTSVFGGTTANSEWEFLTNNTMFYLEAGHVPYQQYIHSDAYSLVSVLKDAGYTTKALHPYYKNGYRRDYVYPFFGFDTFDTMETLPKIKTLKGRGYASDKYTYNQIIKQFEKKDDDEKLFSFTVTMQNHGGYNDKNYKPNITLTEYDDPVANEYLSLIKKSDEALEYITNYFADYDEDVILLMFGDHQPSNADMTDEFINRDTIDPEKYNITKFITPFIIWANYDIDEEEIEAISLNYLSVLLLDEAGINTTPYMDYLRELRKEIPVMNVSGYMDSDYNFHEKTDLGKYKKQIKQYEYMQYNNIFDKDKVDELFSLSN